MPSLVAFGRRWNISSDDFVFPELTEAIVRIIWVVAAVVIFLLHEPFECESPEWIVYIIVMITINIISAGFCLYIMALSAKGSILEMNARKHIVTLLYIRVPLFIAELIWTITSTIVAFGGLQLEMCTQGIRIALFLEWILILAVVLGIFLVFNPHGHRMERSMMIERGSWSQILALCKICQDNEMRDALDDIALLMASFFADNDFVASDIVAGLLLFVHSPYNQHLTLSCNELDNLQKVEWMRTPNCFPTACRMFDIAVAIYGWPTYVFNNCGCFGCFRLCRKSRRGKLKNAVILDDSSSFHTSAFLLVSECNESDLWMVSFQNRLFQVPFVVLTDHQSKSIVIAIRGSASLTDLVTDLSLNDELFSIDVDRDPLLRDDETLDTEGEVRVHRGMLKAARFVYDQIKEHKIIEKTMEQNPTYNLVACGHSLGGGIASLLTLLLKQTYPDVRCYAFSPPGCVISQHGLTEMEHHVLSIFVGDDVIPRISMQSLQVLKSNINREIFSTDKAKYEILIKGIFKLFFSAAWELHSNVPTDTPTDTRDRRRLINSHGNYGANESIVEDPTFSVTDPLGSVISQAASNRVQLYPPGHLLCLQFDTDNRVKTNWVNIDYLSEIRLTSTMFTDHWPKRVRKILCQAKDDISHVNI